MMMRNACTPLFLAPVVGASVALLTGPIAKAQFETPILITGKVPALLAAEGRRTGSADFGRGYDPNGVANPPDCRAGALGRQAGFGCVPGVGPGSWQR